MIRKCKFHKNCKYYHKLSKVCNKTGGMYYSPTRPAGCYKDRFEIQNILDGLKILRRNPAVHSGSIKIMEERLKQLQDD